ncbi:MAG TPA: hypothetical protein EYQ14_18790 [Gammaproteobacteria bacterium]|nr:hypothetical protein [Gammaproteobacteria bacterium]
MSRLLIGLLRRWVVFVENHARQVLVGLILLTFVSAFISVRYSRINSDLSTLVEPSAELAWYQYDSYYKEAFPELLETAVVVVSGTNSATVDDSASRVAEALRQRGDFEFVFAPGLDELITSKKLYFLDEENLDLWIKGVQYNYGALLRISDSANLTNFVYTFADQISNIQGLPIPEPLVSVAESFEPGRLAGGSQQAGLRGYPRLIDETVDRYYQLIVVKGEQQHDRTLPNEAVINSIRDVVNSAAIDPGVSVRLTGEVALANEEVDAGLSGVGIAGTLSLILLAIILAVGIRSKRIIGVIFTLLLMGVIMTTGFATLAVGSYNVLSLIFVVMFFGLGVDFAVHFALRIREAASEDDVADACGAAVTDIGSALLLCMVTSMVAFLSFAPTAYRGLAELGIISAGGMLIAFGLTLTLLPALFKIYGVPQQKEKKLPTFEVRLKPNYVLVTVTLLSMLAFYFARDIRFDYSVLAMRDASTEAMTTLLELQDEKIATDYSISVLARNAQHAEALKVRLQELEVVGDVSIPADFLPHNQAAKREKLKALFELYESIEEVLPGEPLLLQAADTAAENDLAGALDYLLTTPSHAGEEDKHIVHNLKAGLNLYVNDRQMIARFNQMLFEELETELRQLRIMLAAEPFRVEDISDDLRRRMISPSGEHLMTVQPARPLTTRKLTEAFITAVNRVAPNIAGRSVIEWGVGSVVVESFIFAGSLSFVCITILLLFYFRNIVLPVLVLVPIMLALLFTFAICQITGITLNMANILVVPLIIGLGVDTGIHVVHRYTHYDGVEGVYSSSTARAVLISGLTTAGTFFSLSFSPHKGAASVGLLLTIAILLLILATFIVLPALLRVIKYQSSSAH